MGAVGNGSAEVVVSRPLPFLSPPSLPLSFVSVPPRKTALRAHGLARQPRKFTAAPAPDRESPRFSDRTTHPFYSRRRSSWSRMSHNHASTVAAKCTAGLLHCHCDVFADRFANKSSSGSNSSKTKSSDLSLFAWGATARDKGGRMDGCMGGGLPGLPRTEVEWPLGARADLGRSERTNARAWQLTLTASRFGAARELHVTYLFDNAPWGEGTREGEARKEGSRCVASKLPRLRTKSNWTMRSIPAINRVRTHVK